MFYYAERMPLLSGYLCVVTPPISERQVSTNEGNFLEPVVKEGNLLEQVGLSFHCFPENSCHSTAVSVKDM